MDAKIAKKKSNNRRSWRANVLLLFASSAFCVVVIEVFLGLIEPKSAPGTTYGKMIHINSDGFRDHEFAIPKAPNTYRILVLGDSFTWGVGLDVEQTSPKVLERQLNARGAGPKIEVMNAAIPGYNTLEHLRLLKNRGLKYEPDTVLLVYNLNDIDYKPEVSADASREELNARPVDAGTVVAAGQFDHRKGIRGLVLVLQGYSRFADLIVSRSGPLLRRFGFLSSADYSWVEKTFQGYTEENPGWIETASSLREIAEITTNRKIRFVIAIYPLLVELDRYRGKQAHATVRSLCTEIGIECVDLLEVFEYKSGRSFWVNWKDSHPNAEAHRLVAERILRSIDLSPVSSHN